MLEGAINWCADRTTSQQIMQENVLENWRIAHHQQALVTVLCRVHPAGHSLGTPLQVCTWAMAWTWVLTGGVDEGQCPCNPADLHNQHMGMDMAMAISLPLMLSLSLVECPKGFRWGAAEGS